ncbi:MAG: SDR family oxidoreductase [Erysipelotrichales bacterium]|nr:SDR family oxidoreductase [Erysipelotrichales bacterium]
MKALITGATSGIGKDMARYLASLGYDLILVGRRKQLLTELKKELDVDVTIMPLDLAEFDNVELVYNEVKKQNIDILINNAGFGLFGEFSKTDIETEMKMINVNIKQVHYLSKMFLKDFIKRDSGYILNVASSAGFMAGPKLSTYYATKNYVLKLTLAIYEELRRNNSNVHISALCPGPVDTEFNKVAKGEFHTKAATSEYVAKYAIDKMFKNKLIIIPTLKMKIAIFFTRFVPTKLLLKITYNIQDRKTK